MAVLLTKQSMERKKCCEVKDVKVRNIAWRKVCQPCTIDLASPVSQSRESVTFKLARAVQYSVKF